MERGMNLAERISFVAEKLDIHKKTVDLVVYYYIDHCIHEITAGRRVNFLGLASLIPKEEQPSYRETFAYVCQAVSVESRVTAQTVRGILTEYVKSVQTDLESGKTANVYGLLTLKPVVDGGVVTGAHALASASIRYNAYRHDNGVRARVDRMYVRELRERSEVVTA